MISAAQAVDEQYAKIHNADVDNVLNLVAKRDAATYYSKFADRRIAEHLNLYRDRPARP